MCFPSTKNADAIYIKERRLAAAFFSSEPESPAVLSAPAKSRQQCWVPENGIVKSKTPRSMEVAMRFARR